MVDLVVVDMAKMAQMADRSIGTIIRDQSHDHRHQNDDHYHVIHDQNLEAKSQKTDADHHLDRQPQKRKRDRKNQKNQRSEMFRLQVHRLQVLSHHQTKIKKRRKKDQKRQNQ